MGSLRSAARSGLHVAILVSAASAVSARAQVLSGIIQQGNGGTVVGLSDYYDVAEIGPGLPGPLAMSYSDSGGGVAVSADIEADFGVVRTRSVASGAIFEDPYTIYVNPIAVVSDTFTITSPGLSGTGMLTASIRVSGTGWARQPPEVSAAQAAAEASYSTSLSLTGDFGSTTYDGAVSGTWRSVPYGHYEGDALPAIVSVTMPFEYGVPITLNISSGSASSLVNPLTGPAEGNAIEAAVDLFGTAAWLGFDEILDGGGQAVTEYSVVSASGFDYSQPHPSALPSPRFADVPLDYWAHAFVETLAESGVTSGCGGDNYCPEDSVTRAQMAVFLERGMRGSAFVPPAASGSVFLDVGMGDFAAAYIEQLILDGITSGCGGNNYCPNDAVTRAQMAVFLLRARHGAGYTPPAPTGVFGDVSLAHWAVSWIEQLAAEGITSGCGNGNYCPEASVTRAQMAVFLVRTFGL